jgi:carbamate kinase
LTDVPAVSTQWPPSPQARPIGRTTPAELRRYSFADGSMGPKVEAACWFAEATAGFAAIGALNDAPAILAGAAGTIVQVADS